MDNIEVAMGLIAGAGDARGDCMDAIELAKEGKFDEARSALDRASHNMADTHEIQTQLIRDELNGSAPPVSLLMVHAQDHLNLALVMRDLAEELVIIHEKMRHMEERLCSSSQ
ncbi:MAG TPA: PTS lactose/cellobiose transporter subunit IIA [Pseudoflavonifractor sp.]|nr:PTS lactose/cellobiose transporter subunit IIA [Pseudoflavonifractor sp.]